LLQLTDSQAEREKTA